MAKITRKSYKRKKIVTGFAIFGSVAVVSLGVVTWIISRNVVAQEEADLHVNTISDASMAITNLKIVDTENPSVETNDFSFAPPIDDDTGWVRWGIANQLDVFDDPERLSLTISGTIVNAQNLDKLTVKCNDVPPCLSLSSTIVNPDDENEKEKSACVKQYVIAPSFIYEETEITNIKTYERENTTYADFSFEFRFEWGYLFGGDEVNKIPGINPSLYYDSEDALRTLTENKDVESIRTALRGLLDDVYDTLNNVKINLTITATPN